MISKETGQDNEGGQHSEMVLSQEDREFIRSKANEILSA